MIWVVRVDLGWMFEWLFETREQMIVQWIDFFRWFSTVLFLVKILLTSANLNGIVSHCEWLFAACCVSFGSAGSAAAENDGGHCLSGHSVLDYLHHLLRLPRHCRRRQRYSASAGMKDGAGAIGCHLHSLGYYHHHHLRLRHLTAQISVKQARN